MEAPHDFVVVRPEPDLEEILSMVTFAVHADVVVDRLPVNQAAANVLRNLDPPCDDLANALLVNQANTLLREAGLPSNCP